MLQINIRIGRSPAAGLTRNGKCSKQKLHTTLLFTQNQCSWLCTTCQLPVHSMLSGSNYRWKTWHFCLQT